MNPHVTRRAVYASAFVLVAALAACSSPTAVRVDRTQFRLRPPMTDSGYRPPPPPPRPRVAP
jgi:hypothetical protein